MRREKKEKKKRKSGEEEILIRDSLRLSNPFLPKSRAGNYAGG